MIMEESSYRPGSGVLSDCESTVTRVGGVVERSRKRWNFLYVGGGWGWTRWRSRTSDRSCLISSVSSSHCWVYCHLAVFSLSTICNRCRCFCSSSSFCSSSLLKLRWKRFMFSHTLPKSSAPVFSFLPSKPILACKHFYRSHGSPNKAILSKKSSARTYLPCLMA